MKRYLYPLLSVLVILATFSACKDDDDVDPVGGAYDLNELATGAAMHGTNGLGIGPDGNLYIASFLGQEIIVMNKQNGSIIKRMGQDMGVKSPDDLVFGPDGSLYWTDILVGEVARMSPGGVVTRQFVAPGVNPITFSDDGRLFVALDFQGDGLYELDPDLIDPPRGLIVQPDPETYPLGFLNGFEFGPDGLLYGPLFAAGLVISIDVGAPGDPFSSDPWSDGTIEIVAGEFTTPAAAKFGPDGLLYVVDQSGEVFKVDIQTGTKTLFVTLQEGLDNLVFDGNTLYVSNADFGWIMEVQPSGQMRTISIGGMISPGGLAILPGTNNSDALYEADLFRLREYNGLTGQLENVDKGHLLGGPGNLTPPFTVSADGSNLVVSSWFGGVVQVWNPQNKEVLEEHVLAAPINAIRFKDDLVVADLGLGGVVWASDPTMMILPEPTSSGIATNGEVLWVADWATGTVWQIDFDGKTPKAPVALATGLILPEGLALDHDGSLVVVESGAGRLSRINVFTGEVTKIVDGLALGDAAVDQNYPPTWTFDGVAIGSSGDIYVSGFGKNVIYRLTKN